MSKYFCAIVIACLCLIGSPVMACTGLVVSDGDRVLVGNNEDWSNPCTKIWFMQPVNDRYGSVFFGFDDYAAQGGMNQKGLFFDGFSLKEKEVTGQEGKPHFEGDLIKEIMTTCATVEEALTILDKYNLDQMRNYQIFIADAGGDAAIIEGGAVVRKTGRFQVVTNFRQSQTEAGDISCPRYKIARDMLASCTDVNISLVRRILAATHNELFYPTLYSNIYDLKAGKVHVYYFHNFEEEVVFDLDEELEKKTGVLDLPALFPPSNAAGIFRDRFTNLKKEFINDSPHFIVRYPSLYEAGESLDPSQVFLARNPSVQVPVLTVSVTPAEPEMTLALVGGEVYAPMLRRLGKKVRVDKNQPVQLGDGSKAYETRFSWLWEGEIRINSLVVSTFREGRLIQVGLHHTGELDYLKHIPYSLSFE